MGLYTYGHFSKYFRRGANHRAPSFNNSWTPSWYYHHYYLSDCFLYILKTENTLKDVTSLCTLWSSISDSVYLLFIPVRLVVTRSCLHVYHSWLRNNRVYEPCVFTCLVGGVRNISQMALHYIMDTRMHVINNAQKRVILFNIEGMMPKLGCRTTSYNL